MRKLAETMVLYHCYYTELWLDWIRDEMKIVDSDSSEDREKIYKYFQRATKDYMCEYSIKLILLTILWYFIRYSSTAECCVGENACL